MVAHVLLFLVMSCCQTSFRPSPGFFRMSFFSPPPPLSLSLLLSLSLSLALAFLEIPTAMGRGRDGNTDGELGQEQMATGTHFRFGVQHAWRCIACSQTHRCFRGLASSRTVRTVPQKQ